MGKLDPQLEFLTHGGIEVVQETNSESEIERYGIEMKPKKRGAQGPPPAQVEILVQFAGDPADLESAGMKIRSIAGDVVSGTIAVDAVGALADIAEVERIESSRAMYPELDLAIVDTNVDDVHTGPPGRRGAGVIVGIVDTGIDFTHPSFRRADGTTRIINIWDQGLAPGSGESSPAGFGYGVEYGSPQVNAALGTADPFTSVRHRDPNAHGTHVSGIAAGDGSAAGQGRPGGTFLGVAPEADLIVVANASNGAMGLGTSSNTLDAVNYIFQRAQALGRPAVVNMSLGDNLGPHDGTSLLERGLDNLLGGPGRVFVKSAGNAAADGIHAQGTVTSGATVDVRFNQPAGDTTTNQIDIWYEGADTFRASVVDPGGNVVGPVNVGNAATLNLPGGNTVRIDHRNNDPFNGDKRVFLTFARGTAATLLGGNWTIRLNAVASPSGGRFDAWIQRGEVVPRFIAPHESAERTISTPGTATEVITAASYITRGAGVGSLSSFSSRGPTRDGRLAPTIAAPGQSIISARAHPNSLDPYVQMSGTSMAAPHVTGVIALMLQKTPTLTAAQAATRLRNSARTDAFTGPVPNTAWGAGKIDAWGAVGDRIVVPSVVTDCPSVPRSTCPRSVPFFTCPSIIVNTCPTSVPATACPVSVPRLSCPVFTVPATCGPSVLTPCPSRPITTCPIRSVTTPCPQSVPAPCGFDPTVVVFDPIRTAGPQRGFDPSMFDPSRFMPPGRFEGGSMSADVDAAEASEHGGEPAPELPEQGFYDYDEGWFE